MSSLAEYEIERLSSKLGKNRAGHWHFCAACNRLHRLPFDGWQFDGNVETPTFTPSFNHTWGKDRRCHYFVTAGEIMFLPDCTHSMAGITATMVDLPDAHDNL